MIQKLCYNRDSEVILYNMVQKLCHNHDSEVMLYNIMQKLRHIILAEVMLYYPCRSYVIYYISYYRGNIEYIIQKLCYISNSRSHVIYHSSEVMLYIRFYPFIYHSSEIMLYIKVQMSCYTSNSRNYVTYQILP